MATSAALGDAGIISADFLSLIVTNDTKERRCFASPIRYPDGGSEDENDATEADGRDGAPQDFELVGPRTLARLHKLYGSHRLDPDLLVAEPVAVAIPQPELWNSSTVGADVRAELEERFEALDPIMNVVLEEIIHSDCELVLAGGAVFSALRGIPLAASDLDFFFVSPSLDTDAASQFFSRLLDVFDVLDAAQEGFVTVTRNENCTTVKIGADFDTVESYQFIHRLYPSAASVIGGFDLGCCSVMLHDALQRVSMTHLAAWSIALNMVIVDTTLRSTR
jgi:hypothetical protein